MARASVLLVLASLAALCASCQGDEPRGPRLKTTRLNEQNLHVSVTFSLRDAAAQARIYFAQKPDLAPNGGFRKKNIWDFSALSAEETARGSWSSDSSFDPGTYFVVLSARNCRGCERRYSNVLTLRVPTPAQTYRASIKVRRDRGLVDLILRVSNLGDFFRVP